MTKGEKVDLIITLSELGATWNDLTRFLKQDKKELQALFNYVPLSDDYEENVRLIKKIWNRIDNNSDIVLESVTLVETGMLMREDTVQIIKKANGYLAIPKFCIEELENLSKSTPVAVRGLAIANGKNIKSIDLEKRFYLRKPREHFKARAFTIVETACKLCDDGRDVTIWTTSYEVQNLAREQRMKSLKIIKF